MDDNSRMQQEVALGDSVPVGGQDASERLWCIRIEELDDYIAVDSHETAEREAAAINAYIEGFENGRRAAAGVRAMAIEWPFAQESHARSLAEDWDDLQHMPHRRTGAYPPKSMLTSISQRVKELVRMARKLSDVY